MGHIAVDWAYRLNYPAEVCTAVRYVQSRARYTASNSERNKEKFDRYMALIEEHRLCFNCKRFKRYHSPAGDCLFDSTKLELVSSKLSDDPIWWVCW